MRLSGPLLDRIDLHIEVPRVHHQDLVDNQNGESSETIRRRVELARQVQRERFHKHQLYINAQMQSRHIRTFCALQSEGEQLLAQVTQRLGLSARSYGLQEGDVVA